MFLYINKKILRIFKLCKKFSKTDIVAFQKHSVDFLYILNGYEVINCQNMANLKEKKNVCMNCKSNIPRSRREG